MRAPPSFAAFLDHLVAAHGAEAAAIRHEAYFQAHKPWPRARAVAALVREAWSLSLRPGPRLQKGEAEGVVFVATLPGASGWNCLASAMAPATDAGIPVTTVVHPRLGARGRWLPRPPLRAFAEAAREFLRPGRGGPVPGMVVGAALARRALWRGAWRAALGGGGAVVLHNDFDMMSAAAVGLGWPSLCLQHGVPTAEFFPARADVQVVWGESSAAAYRSAGCAAVVVDALGRDAGVAHQATEPPAGIALVSQSHTTVYGPDLAARLRELAAALPAGTRVLLHPQEGAGDACYAGLSHLALERPPHRLLTHGPRHLVIGYCSTALLDAARAGHDVVGLDWPAQDSAAALAVGAPPRRIGDAAAAVRLFEELRRDPALCAAVAAERTAWLVRTFSPAAGGFVAALRGAAS